MTDLPTRRCNGLLIKGANTPCAKPATHVCRYPDGMERFACDEHARADEAVARPLAEFFAEVHASVQRARHGGPT